ncbi:MAG: YceI family protein [Bacteroidetes bacterium]|jgi:polyisoprenoid-binding protein YceI|nr:YceI family protein [Bacteroidota bacterium]
MKKIQLTFAALALMASSMLAQTNWGVDASHSKLGFKVTHMMVSETEGKFKIYDGKVSSKTDADFTDATVEFSVDASSIDTDDDKRDGHLKSADFFDAEKHPKITFKSTSMKKGKAKGTYILVGDLTMKGVTKPVTFQAVTNGKVVKDPYGKTRTGFLAQATINRKDFGLAWNATLEAGGVAVSEEVKIECAIELVK